MMYFGTSPVAEVALFQGTRQRAEPLDSSAATRLAAIAAHRPDVVVADRGRVVEYDFITAIDRRRRD